MAPGAIAIRRSGAVLGQPIRDSDLETQLGVPAVNDSDRVLHSNWGWPLTDIEVVKPIVPATGKQGLWLWRMPTEAADGP